MDPARLAQLVAGAYIPCDAKREAPKVPSYHPCLIVQDSQTDVGKVKECGCSDKYCVRDAPGWIPASRR